MVALGSARNGACAWAGNPGQAEKWPAVRMRYRMAYSVEPGRRLGYNESRFHHLSEWGLTV